MKKKYWKHRLLAVLVLCMLTSGCGKKNEAEEDTQKEKEPEKVIVIDERPALEEEEIQEEAVQETPEPVVLDELQQQLETILWQIQAYGSPASAYVEDLSTEAYASVSDQQMQSASLIKLFIAGTVYERMEEMRTQEGYEGETEELLRVMISVSDNDAANTLTARLGYGDAAAGMAAVNQFCQEHGYHNTYMGRLMLDFASAEDNYTSVGDCGSFLKAVYRQELAGAESILNYMKQQERTEKIPMGVPEGVETANKTGELTDVENDAAIIFLDSGAYTVCVMSSGLQNTESARGVIREVSSAAYQYMVNLD